MNPESLKNINGFPMFHLCSEENIRSSMAYQPRVGDVIIVTYPKCGTKWTQYIVSNILTKGNVPEDPVEYMLFTPHIEMMGAEAAENPARKGPLMTHLSLSNMVFSKQAKYIYVARNPFDCCVSYYHFMKGVTPKTFDATFGAFLEIFISGECAYGGYFEHLLPWYGLRNEPNVLFFTYEQLKRNTEEMVITIADFVGAEHGGALRADKSLLEEILELCSSRNMKIVFNYSPADIIKRFAELPPERSLKSMEVYNKPAGPTQEMHDGSGFVRKGIIGDWRNHFTPQHIAAMKAWIDEKTTGSDVMDLWKGLDLP
ncbi:hypothetical protein HPB49_018681 [Dermacentor silvarum]|uniref:Uncharacterized protein n=1 Tax=Dermacentor silvarum TaxID=543639 RepID=A0ACB8DK48_DERSI|nr:hypothetical protein HPB49_018681 [Dermacentor silvarum]